MAAHNWLITSVGGILMIYMSGFLFFSISNMPRHSIQKYQFGRFGEIKNTRNRVANSLIQTHQFVHWCKELKFLDLTNDEKYANLTALASFPGSGNTWLRYLLQQVTGILTGSIYKDNGLLKSGFPAEGIFNKSVLVVKTHEWGPKSWINFSKAILLIRDPEKAILAEFNRRGGGHVGFASPDRYKRKKGKYWQQFVKYELKNWELMNLAWAQKFTGTLLIIYYNELLTDMETTLRKTLKFLDFNLNEENLSCTLYRKEGIYKRKTKIQMFDPYTAIMYRRINFIKNKVYALLGHKNYR